MQGRIKFVDKKTERWGFINPDDGGEGVYFNVEDVLGPRPTFADAGIPVEFDIASEAGRPRAVNVRLLEPPRPPVQPPPSLRPPTRLKGPGNALLDWAFVPFVPFTDREGKQWSSVLEDLAARGLTEKWHFGPEPDPSNPWPILRNYLTYTFLKVQREGKVFEATSGGRGWAAFNTGLVDMLYDPIYALFETNDREGAQPWRFYDLCVPGKRASGKQLTAVFDPLPEPPQYFSTNFDMLLDTSRDVHVDYEHVILDGIRRDRFPPAFVQDHLPKGMDWTDYRHVDRQSAIEYLQRLTNALEEDYQMMRSIKRRLEDAKLLAEKRTKWNFKTAIPQYYPRFDVMSLLLPLALLDDERVDVALVVTRNPSGSYQGRTVLPLDWAYMNARLVCRPDSDWLITEAVVHGPSALPDDEEEDQIPELPAGGESSA